MQQLNPKKIILVVNSSTLTNVYGQSMTQSIADADDYVIKRGLDPELRLTFDFGLSQTFTVSELNTSGGPACITPGFVGLMLVPALQAAMFAWEAEGVIFSTYTPVGGPANGGYTFPIWSILSKYPSSFADYALLSWQTTVQRVTQNWSPWVESDGVTYPSVYNTSAQVPSGRLGCPVTQWSSDQIAEYPIVGQLVATTQGTLKSLQGTVTPGSGYTARNDTRTVHFVGGSGSGAIVFAYTPPDVESSLATSLSNSSVLPQTVVIGDVTKWGTSGVFLVGTEQIAYSGLTYSTYTSPSSTGNPYIGTLNITQRGYGGTTVEAHTGGKAKLLNASTGAVTQVISLESGYGYQIGDVLTATAGDLGATGSGFQYTVTHVGSSYQIWYDVDPVSLGIAVGQRVRGIFIPELTFVQSISSVPGSYYVYVSRSHSLSSAASVTIPITYYNESMTDPALSAYKSAVTNALAVELENQQSKCHVLSQAVTYVPYAGSTLVAPVSLVDTTIYVNSVNNFPNSSQRTGGIWVGSELMHYTNFSAITNTFTVTRTSPTLHVIGEPVVWVNSDNQQALNFAKDNNYSNIYEVCYQDASYAYAPYYIKDGGGGADNAPPAIDPAIAPIFCLSLVTNWNWGQGGTLPNGDGHTYFTESMRGRVLPGAWGCTWTSFEHIFGQGLVLNGGSAAIITVGEPGSGNLRSPGQIFITAATYQMPLMLAYFLSSNYPNGINYPGCGVIGDPLYTPYKSTPTIENLIVGVTKISALGQTSGAVGLTQSTTWNNIKAGTTFLTTESGAYLVTGLGFYIASVTASSGSWANIPGTSGGAWTNIPGTSGGAWTNIPGTGGGTWTNINNYIPPPTTQTVTLSAVIDPVDGDIVGYMDSDPYYGSFGSVVPTTLFNYPLTILITSIDTGGFFVFALSGFTTSPGINFFTRIVCGAYTLDFSMSPRGAQAILYFFDLGTGTASWYIPRSWWFPFVNGQTYDVTFIQGPNPPVWDQIVN